MHSSPSGVFNFYFLYIIIIILSEEYSLIRHLYQNILLIFIILKNSLIRRVMNVLVRFMVLGDPRGKERPKFARRGAYTKAYTPAKTREYERKVRSAYQRYCNDLKLEGPISANIYSEFSIPKSLSKKKKELLDGSYHTQKPDNDNIVKIVLDPINEVAFDDDKQVAVVNAEKRYGSTPRVVVELEELNKKPATKVISPIYFVDEKGNRIDELFRR